MAQVVFDPVAFKARYPEFASVSNTLLQECFEESGLYLSNDDNSIVQDLDRRARLLNMLTAHIAYLGGPPKGLCLPGLNISRLVPMRGLLSLNMALHSGRQPCRCAVSGIAHVRRCTDHATQGR